MTSEIKKVMFILCIFISCNEADKNKNESGLKMDKIDKYLSAEENPLINKKKTNKECPFYINDTVLGESPFSFDIFNADTLEINSVFKIPPIKSFEEKTFEGNIYYLHVYSFKKSYIKLYDCNGYFIEELNIQDKEINLRNNFKIGMSKKDFLRFYNCQDIACDTFIISDINRTQEFAFVFKSDQLIRFYLYSSI